MSCHQGSSVLLMQQTETQREEERSLSPVGNCNWEPTEAATWSNGIHRPVATCRRSICV